MAELAAGLNTLCFPPWDSLPYDRASPSASISGRRLATLAALAQPATTGPLVVVTTSPAAMQRIRPRGDVRSRTMRLAVGQPWSAPELLRVLAGAGYVEAEPANDPGEMAVRESLVDVFPVGAGEAVRVDLRDGVIAALRPYDPASQRSADGTSLHEILLPPGSEVPWDVDARARFGAAWERNGMGGHPLAAAVAAGRRPTGIEQWLPQFCDRTETLFSYFDPRAVLLEPGAEAAAEAWLTQLEDAFAMRRRMAEVERASDIAPYVALPPSDIALTFDEWRQTVKAAALLQSSFPQPASRQEKEPGGRPAGDLAGIAVGNLVVHPDHGIGLFDGFETVGAEGMESDCLRLLYAGGDKLLVPAETADQVHPYGGTATRLDKLGGAAWNRRLGRIKAELVKVAADLVATMATRSRAVCPPIGPPPGYARFAGRFPHEETRDQRRAIDDVLADLSSGRPMDRLVCGDVGFGKTEIALRAAFCVAGNGAQVAVIAPTRPLCRQHFDDFCARFAGWPWRVEMIARGASPSKTRTVTAGLADGAVSVAIGTQALLEASFARLGLVVVDEEQRLGVRDKERLKELGPCVHVVTMTATPIPRTLQMALAGLRDLSLIQTPPVARRPVRTFVLPFDPVSVRQALMREFRRGGQSFVICPRIEDIPVLEERLRAVVPELDTAVLHGRLSPSAMDRTLTAFAEGRHDLMLATNIVENGLNLVRANTIVVHRADMFGLAALHQLRGRVGRGAVQAYAYLTHEPGAELPEAAARRLDTIAAIAGPGAGFQLALHDRDMRGAGALFGEAQAGHLKDLGPVYLDALMRQAVAEVRGEPPRPAAPTVRLGATARLPEGYVADPAIRLWFYRRLARDDEPATAITSELADRFGPLPPEAELAVAVHKLVRLCGRMGIVLLEAGPKGAVIEFRDAVHRSQFRERVPDTQIRKDGRLAVRGPWQDPERRARDLLDLIEGAAP